MDAIKRLEELLDQKDQRIEELESQIQELTDESEKVWDWAHHKTYPADKEPGTQHGLPVPRLELRGRPLDEAGYNAEWVYCLVYKHLLDHVVFIPLGSTQVGGGSSWPPPIYEDGKMFRPRRDGRHIENDAQQLGLPAFVIADDRVEKVEVAK